MRFYDLIDQLDAVVFVSDMLYDDNKRERLKKMIERWGREINRHEEYYPSKKGEKDVD